MLAPNPQLIIEKRVDEMLSRKGSVLLSYSANKAYERPATRNQTNKWRVLVAKHYVMNTSRNHCSRYVARYETEKQDSCCYDFVLKATTIPFDKKKD